MGSMYVTFVYILVDVFTFVMVNVAKYTIHGSSGDAWKISSMEKRNRGYNTICHPINSLKRTAKALENWWLKDDPFWGRFGPLFRGVNSPLVLWRVYYFTCYEVGAHYSPFYRFINFITRLKRGFFRPQVIPVLCLVIYWGLIYVFDTRKRIHEPIKGISRFMSCRRCWSQVTMTNLDAKTLCQTGWELVFFTGPTCPTNESYLPRR